MSHHWGARWAADYTSAGNHPSAAGESHVRASPWRRRSGARWRVPVRPRSAELVELTGHPHHDGADGLGDGKQLFRVRAWGGSC